MKLKGQDHLGKKLRWNVSETHEILSYEYDNTKLLMPQMVTNTEYIDAFN
jgi:hypothetical protein